jgi:hypothetical protein
MTFRHKSALAESIICTARQSQFGMAVSHSHDHIHIHTGLRSDRCALSPDRRLLHGAVRKRCRAGRIVEHGDTDDGPRARI